MDDVHFLPRTEGEKPSPVRKVVRKSVTFLRELLRIYSNPGDTVLEICSGSSPACRASVMEGRNCVAVDNDLEVVNAVSAHVSMLHEKVNKSLTSGSQPPLQFKRKKKRKKGSHQEINTSIALPKGTFAAPETRL